MPSRLPPGIGLRYAPEDFSRLRSARPPSVDFLKVDAEALMIDGGPHVRRLEVLRGQYRLSLHGAGWRSARRSGLTTTICDASCCSRSACARPSSPSILPGRAQV